MHTKRQPSAAAAPRRDLIGTTRGGSGKSSHAAYSAAKAWHSNGNSEGRGIRRGKLGGGSCKGRGGVRSDRKYMSSKGNTPTNAVMQIIAPHICDSTHIAEYRLSVGPAEAIGRLFVRHNPAIPIKFQIMYYICSVVEPVVIMNRTISIKGSCEIYVGRTESILPRVLPRQRVIVITDANIDRLYPELVHRFDYVIIGHGEASKTLMTVQKVYKRLMELGADRSTFLLGIGGGIVTDVTGFAAATYMRGLDFGFISTTLLGQVDASVGGKNGVNVNDYKNMVGTFTQPRFVISDVEMLRTLPARELRAGMAEAVKTAVIADRELFEYMERQPIETLLDNPQTMCNIVWSCIRIKADIVERDEREGGARRVLNLGHTMAHAIEKCAHEINHGEAVAMGMAMICDAAAGIGAMAREDRDRISALLEKMGFQLIPPVPTARLLREVRKDKKKQDDAINVVIPTGIGGCTVRKMSFDRFAAMF